MTFLRLLRLLLLFLSLGTRAARRNCGLSALRSALRHPDRSHFPGLIGQLHELFHLLFIGFVHILGDLLCAGHQVLCLPEGLLRVL